MSPPSTGHYSDIDIGILSPLLRYRPIVVISNWTFQGTLYADRSERYFRLFSDLLYFVLIFIIFSNQNTIMRSVLALFLAHTINWIFNGQLFVLLKNFGMVHNDPQIIINYAYDIRDRSSRKDYIECVAVYGSLSRGEIKSTSDLDVRIIRKPGKLNGIKACTFGFIERTRALYYRFPLDLYVVDSKRHLKKLRDDESPIILYRSQKSI